MQTLCRNSACARHQKWHDDSCPHFNQLRRPWPYVRMCQLTTENEHPQRKLAARAWKEVMRSRRVSQCCGVFEQLHKWCAFFSSFFGRLSSLRCSGDFQGTIQGCTGVEQQLRALHTNPHDVTIRHNGRTKQHERCVSVIGTTSIELLRDAGSRKQQRDYSRRWSVYVPVAALASNMNRQRLEELWILH